MNEPNDSTVVTRNWNIVNDNSKTSYGVGNEITHNTEVLKSSICDYNGGYILVKSGIAIIGHQKTQVAFKNCALFTKAITKIVEKNR